jgi:hypothetical protein
LSAVNTQAQACSGSSGPSTCTPTAGLDSPGFYPSDTALPCVVDGQAYNQVINLVAPSTADNFPVDSIRIATLTNLPCGLCWASGSATNTIAGGKPGCIRVSGISNEAPGEYNVLVYATAYVHLFGSSVPLGPLNADSALGLFYYVRVKVPGGNCLPPDTSGGKGGTASTPGSITTPTITGNTSICPGNPTTLTATGGSYYGYAWSNGATTSSITVSALGTYSVTVYENCNSASSSVTVSSAGGTATITPSGPTTFCQGGSVTLTASSGASYLWSDGETTQQITVTSSGSYSVDVTSGSGCSAQSSVTAVTVNALPTATISAGGPTTFCQGGSVKLTSSAGSAYLWSDGETTSTITVTATGNYSVDVTNASGCSASSSATSVTVNANPTATISAGGPTTFCQGGSVTLTASAGSSYAWSDGETTSAITVTSTGSYTVDVTNASGCSTTSSATAVTVNALPNATITAGGPTTFCSGGSVTLTSSAGASYLWSDGETTGAITVSSSGSYSVDVTNAAGCSASSSATSVTVNANPTATITPGGATTFCQGGSVTLTSSAGFSYNWSDGETTSSITVSSTGNYTVDVTNESGCSTISSATAVTVNALPSATITAGGPTTFCSGGSVTLTSSAGASYLWSDGETTGAITVSSTGSYSVDVTNAAGCSATSSATQVTVNSSPTPTITANGPTEFCQGGSVGLSASVGTSYLWSTGETTQAITVSTSQTETVNVTFAGGCSGTSTSTAVTVDPTPAATITPSGATSFCPGGSVTLTASAAASYGWSDGETTQAITVSGTGNYSVDVTSAAGCSASSSVTAVTVYADPTPAVRAGGPTTFCNGGSVTLTSSAASAYLWSDGETTQAITVTATGSYSVQVTTANGCTATSTATQVTVGASGEATITPNGPTTFCHPDSVVLTASPGLSYKWSNGATTQSITLKKSLSVSVKVTFAAGCSGTSAKTSVTDNALPVATVSADGPTSICEGQSVDLTAASGTGYNYSWSDGETTQAITVTSAGRYNFTVTDGNGCVKVSPQTVVKVGALPDPIIESNIALTFCAGDSAKLTAYPAGKTTYLWSTGATTRFIEAKTTGSYDVTVTSVAGCSAAASSVNVSAVDCTNGGQDSKTSSTAITSGSLNTAFDANVFPNPYSAQFNLLVTSSNTTDNVNVKIFNVNGQLVEERTGVAIGSEVALGNNYTSGFYIVQVQQGQTTRQLRVIKTE